MPDDFLIPPFDAAAALATLRRSLRDLQLAEREGVFELRGQPVARLKVDGATLAADLARRLSRAPEWDARTIKDHADLRRFTDELRKRLARWSDAREDN